MAQRRGRGLRSVLRRAGARRGRQTAGARGRRSGRPLGSCRPTAQQPPAPRWQAQAQQAPQAQRQRRAPALLRAQLQVPARWAGSSKMRSSAWRGARPSRRQQRCWRPAPASRERVRRRLHLQRGRQACAAPPPGSGGAGQTQQAQRRLGQQGSPARRPVQAAWPRARRPGQQQRQRQQEQMGQPQGTLTEERPNRLEGPQRVRRSVRPQRSRGLGPGRLMAAPWLAETGRLQLPSRPEPRLRSRGQAACLQGHRPAPRGRGTQAARRRRAQRDWHASAQGRLLRSCHQVQSQAQRARQRRWAPWGHRCQRGRRQARALQACQETSRGAERRGRRPTAARPRQVVQGRRRRSGAGGHCRPGRHRRRKRRSRL